ncbi:MAG: helix-turn-helix transcriptional regulator, partial [Pseudonocardia sp.]
SDPAPELTALRELVHARRAIVAGNPDVTPGEIGAEIGADAAEELGLAPMAMLHQAIGLLRGGHRDEARGVVETALRHARQGHHSYLVALGLALLAVIAGNEGDYRRMTELAEAADAEPDNPAWQDTLGALWSSTMRAYGALLRADPVPCLELVSDDTDAPRSVRAGLSALRTALRGAALFDLGRSGEGIDLLQEAQLAAGTAPDSAEVTATVALLAHRAATLLGRGDLARTVVSWAEGELGPAGEVVLLRSRQRAALGRHHAANDTLAPLLAGSAPPVLPWTLIEASVLHCQISLRLDRRPQARRSLDDALTSSATMDVLRPLASGPPEVIDLLTRHIGSFGAAEPTALRVLAARRTLDAQPVSLTDRERAVLSMLPTQRSFEEIAVDLTVSHSTVKTHVRAIYSKFGVNSRRDAVASARRYGILITDT